MITRQQREEDRALLNRAKEIFLAENPFLTELDIKDNRSEVNRIKRSLKSNKKFKMEEV